MNLAQRIMMVKKFDVFRGWRVQPTGFTYGRSDYGCTFRELEFYDGLNATGTVISSAANRTIVYEGTVNNQFPPALAFDGNPSTRWSTAGDVSISWALGVTFPESVLAKSVRINPHQGFMPTAFAVQYTQNGVTWITVKEFFPPTSSDTFVGNF